jgi:serine/threonine-protein kinase
MLAVNPAAEAATPKACPSCGKRYPADALFCSFDGSPLATTPGAIAAAAATDVYIGHEINGHIEIRQLVGIGAMGRVYRAFQKGIDRDVAVKILHRELSANPTLVTRFHREAKVASRLAHPNVVHVILTGQLPDGAMYIVMEYLDGLSLQSALGAAGGAMPLPRALHIALQLCDAAGEAHAQGVVHRDLKPENVMLVKRSDDPDYVKVLDFGIARLNWGEQSMATAAGLIFGTARYISPEGAQGEKVGPQGDVYSIATIVYQMLAGRTPFDADQAVALLVQQIHDAPRTIESIERASYVPAPIARVVMNNLSKKPLERAENARAFGRALLEAAVESGLSAQDILSRPAMLPGTRGTTPGAVQLPSMQKTHQLQLSPEDAARLAPAPASTSPAPPAASAIANGNGESGRPGKTAYMTPAPAPSRGTVSSDTRTQIRTELGDDTAPPPSSLSAPPTAETKRWTPPADFEAKLVPPPPPSGVDLTMDDQQQGLPSRPAVAPTAAPSSSPSLPTSPPSSRTAPTGPPTGRGFSNETRVADEAADIEAARQTGQGDSTRPLLIVGACFVLGAIAMGLIALKTGLVGGPRARPPAASASALATPDPVVMQPGTPASIQTTSAIPPLAPGKPAPSQVAGPTRASIDVSDGKPAIGEPVDLAGHVGGNHTKIDGAHFHVSGPGIPPGTDITAVDDGTGAFHSSFTFMQPGRFEVDFLARADGAPVRTARLLVVGTPTPGVSPAATDATPATTTTSPPPTPSAKWM